MRRCKICKHTLKRYKRVSWALAKALRFVSCGHSTSWFRKWTSIGWLLSPTLVTPSWTLSCPTFKVTIPQSSRARLSKRPEEGTPAGFTSSPRLCFHKFRSSAQIWCLNLRQPPRPGLSCKVPSIISSPCFLSLFLACFNHFHKLSVVSRFRSLESHFKLREASSWANKLFATFRSSVQSTIITGRMVLLFSRGWSDWVKDGSART